MPASLRAALLAATMFLAAACEREPQINCQPSTPWSLSFVIRDSVSRELVEGAGGWAEVAGVRHELRHYNVGELVLPHDSAATYRVEIRREGYATWRDTVTAISTVCDSATGRRMVLLQRDRR